MAGIMFEVKQQLGVLSHSTKGWSKQFNIVSWNGREAKYDIRDWDEKLEKMGRGVSLSSRELARLRTYLQELDLTVDEDGEFDEEGAGAGADAASHRGSDLSDSSGQFALEAGQAGK